MDDHEIPIRWAAGADDLRGALALRELVFCEEQGVPREEELDEHDEHALHLVALEESSGGVVGTLRLLTDRDGAKIGRVAVAREWRRRGVAQRMLELALDAARAQGSPRVHSRRAARRRRALREGRLRGRVRDVRGGRDTARADGKASCAARLNPRLNPDDGVVSRRRRAVG